MGKLIILSLDESEKGIYDRIMEIINEADISIDKKLDDGRDIIQIGKLVIMPEQHRVLRQDKEVNLTNIEFRILYVLAIHQGITLSKEKIYNFVWNGEYLQDDSNIVPAEAVLWHTPYAVQRDARSSRRVPHTSPDIR